MTSPTDRVQNTAAGYIPDMLVPGVNPFLGLLPRKYWTKKKQFFTYTITYATGSPNPGGNAALAASASNIQASTNIQADADFLLMALTGLVSATDESAVTANPRITLQILDSGSSQGLSDYPVDWNNAVGSAQNPAFLPFPRIFEANSVITSSLTNLIATAKNVRLAFVGFKIYPQDA